MTLDEAINHAEEVAEEQEKKAKEWHENQVRKCELIRFAEMDYTHENECKECAEQHRQLAEWLRELKQLREQQSSEDCVSREKLKKWLDMNFSFGGALRKLELFDRLDKELPSVISKGVTVTDFADKCRECGKQKNGKWIPVSERMPNPGEYNRDVDRYYLVQNEYGDMLVARYAKKGYWEQIYQFGEIKEKIVAWLPLPKPYKAEMENEE